MAMFADNEAAKPNPLLQPFSILVGTWNTVGTHPLAPGKTFHGRTSFSWIASGAFLLMESRIDEPEIPSGIAIFGTDDTTSECSMLYFDERGVSRRARRVADRHLGAHRSARHVREEPHRLDPHGIGGAQLDATDDPIPVGLRVIGDAVRVAADVEEVPIVHPNGELVPARCGDR